MKERLATVLAASSILFIAGLGLSAPAFAHGGGGGSSPTVTSLTADTATPAPSSSGTIEVQLSGAAPKGGSDVTLASSDASALSVPASVTIGSGSSSGQFSYTTGAVSSATAVTVTATLGSSSASATLTVTPAPLSLTLSPSTVQGGDSSTGTVSLGAAAPAGGTTVSLSSAETVASVPANVVIAAGQTSATFQVTTQPVPSEIVFDITATANGTTVFAGLTISAAPAGSGPPAPALAAPAAGASVTVPFTLSWSAVTDPAGGIQYNWQVSPSSSMTPVVDQATTAQASATVSGLADGTYYWQVQAVDADDIAGPYSAPQSFTVTGANSGELPAPTLNAPQGGTSFHPYYTFGLSWTAVPGSTGYVIEADSTNGEFSVLYANPGEYPCVSYGALDVLGFPPPPPPPAGTCATTVGNYAEPGTVYYRVQAINASGALSVPSNVDTVTISYSAPLTAPPEPTAPASTATETFPFTVSFTDVPDPQENAYEVQFSTSSSFKSIEYDVPLIQPTIPFATIPGSTSSFTVQQGLVAGKTYWRVRAEEGDASATAGAVTAFSSTGSFTISSAPPAVVSVTPDTPLLPSGDSGEAQLQLSADAASGGSVVQLTSSNPSALTVPASVTIQTIGTGGPFGGAGVAQSGFQYQGGTVTAPTPVTITATLGSSSTTATVTVEPSVGPISSVTLSPASVNGGTSSTGTVTLSAPAPSGGAVVSLSSGDTAVASVRASVTVPAGAISATFTITTQPVASNTTVVIIGTYEGITSGDLLVTT